MDIALNKTGTNISNGRLLIRLDFQDGLYWQFRPSLSLFVSVDENVTGELLEEFCRDTYTPKVVASIPAMLAKKDSAHYISPYFRNKCVLSSRKHRWNSDVVPYLNSKLDGFRFSQSGLAIPELVTPNSIDVGAGATDRGSDAPLNKTYVDFNNPANATGIIDTYEVWFLTSTTTLVVGFLYGSATTYTGRSSQSIGAAVQGAKRTFSGLTLAIGIGDFCGVYGTNGVMEKDGSGGASIASTEGNALGTTKTDYYVYSADILSLYATGSEVVASGGGAPVEAVMAGLI